ncbi:complement C1q-like protein 2 [Eucyclogobius newberryi]|uniref:complement C1q-like protein 2 n=1 Tax=Eucyclogobius newberryi TaxID=166745 RepID=UPI003B5C8B50
MANTLVFLLLLCAFSSAQDVFKRRSKEKYEPYDIKAVLRGLSAALAEHREKIEQLQALSQEQAAKLKELENQTSEVESMKAKLQGAQVAFSASLFASGSGTIGPYTSDVILPFKYVLTNIGNAYNPYTGYFTAPVSGAYHFEFHINSLGSAYYSSAALVKNGAYTFSAFEQQTSGFNTAANGVTLSLRAGDVVHLRLIQKTVIYDNEAHLSTFSGHLLFPM